MASFSYCSSCEGIVAQDKPCLNCYPPANNNYASCELCFRTFLRCDGEKHTTCSKCRELDELTLIHLPPPAVALPHLPVESLARKAVPLATGCLDYFPDALAAVAALSKIGNDQHNPGQPLHWNRSKSSDEADALLRHFVDRGKLDIDGLRHSAKVAWRALALLQKEIENAGK